MMLMIFLSDIHKLMTRKAPLGTEINVKYCKRCTKRVEYVEKERAAVFERSESSVNSKLTMWLTPLELLTQRFGRDGSHVCKHQSAV